MSFQRITFFAAAFTVSVALSAVRAPSSLAATGLVVHAVEIGVGKFHREDTRIHSYGADNAWLALTLPTGASNQTPLIIRNADQSHSIYFSTLEEILVSLKDLVKSTGQQVQVFNMHGHGAPGVMWFPKDKTQLNSFECGDWNDAASAPDSQNYGQYYSAISKSDIMQIRSMSNNPSVYLPCTTGLKQWQEKAKKFGDLRPLFAPGAQVHFLSCVVGLGKVGETFTQGIADLLLGGDQSKVETSTAFGLGDWSMVEGMGFWDYQNDAQLERDNKAYVKNKTDRDVMQKGAIRFTQFLGGKKTSGTFANRDFMFLDTRRFAVTEADLAAPGETILAEEEAALPLPERIRIPGTNRYLPVLVRQAD